MESRACHPEYVAHGTQREGVPQWRQGDEASAQAIGGRIERVACRGRGTGGVVGPFPGALCIGAGEGQGDFPFHDIGHRGGAVLGPTEGAADNV